MNPAKAPEGLSKTSLKAQGFYEEKTKWGRYMFLEGNPISIDTAPNPTGAAISIPRKSSFSNSQNVGRVLREAYLITDTGELIHLPDQARVVLELRLRFPWLVNITNATNAQKGSKSARKK